MLLANMGALGGDRDRTELAATFAEISRVMFAADTVQGTLQRVVDLSVSTIGGCFGAGISFIDGARIFTPASSTPRILVIDQMQYSTGEGPCLDAIAKRAPQYAPDLASDARWPTFGPMAAAAGMRSLLSFDLYGGAALGALNLYAEAPEGFGPTDRAAGSIFAAHAGIALGVAGQVRDVQEALAAEIRRSEHLQRALESRTVIARAEGILMHRDLATAEEAFDLLRTASQHLNVKLRDVAQSVVDTGDLPGQAPGPRPAE